MLAKKPSNCADAALTNGTLKVIVKTLVKIGENWGKFNPTPNVSVTQEGCIEGRQKTRLDPQYCVKHFIPLERLVTFNTLN